MLAAYLIAQETGMPYWDAFALYAAICLGIAVALALIGAFYLRSH